MVAHIKRSDKHDKKSLIEKNYGFLPVFLNFFSTVALLLVFSSPMHMTAVIYNKTQFRHETGGKKNQKFSSKQHFPFLISKSQRQSNWNCHTAAELTDKEHIPHLEPTVPFV